MTNRARHARVPASEPDVVSSASTRVSWLPGLVVAAVMLVLYGGLALTVDFPKAAIGIQSDEATYYMMGHSLAADGDLTYRREDLVRVWHEFPSGPTGVFLKKGRAIDRMGLMLRPPFVWTATRPDTDPNRYFYGKSFAYPLFAAPFVRVFGTNGFLVLNALLMAAAVLCGYVFLQARTRPAVAAVLSAGFVMASVVPVYFVWIAPELFNFALGVFAYFCWLYKEVATRSSSRGARWLFGPASDVVASLILGLATFSKVSNALMFVPIVAWLLWRRRWRVAVAASAAFALVAAGLFAVNLAISGDWNYQGGERSTFYYEFPLQTPASGFDVGAEKSRSEALTEVIFKRSVFWTNLTHNLAYTFVGRYAGIVPYFFPCAFAIVAFLAGLRRRPLWQALVLIGGLAQPLLFAIVTPYTWLGGGGSVGNRYFMGAYGVFLFLLPPISRVSVALVPWIVGSLFVAPLVLNPFTTSFYPGTYAAHGLFRRLPVELTLVYDWPINTDSTRVRVWYGDSPGQGDPGFQVYFFDPYAYGQETDKSFWVKGASRAEFLIKTDRPMKRLVLTLSAGAAPTDVTATVAGRTQHLSLAPGGTQQLFFSLGEGFPYQGQWPVWTASVSSSNGFVPALEEQPSDDTRYLGVRVKPTLVE
jgi:hypothetical protein